jgi:hypothetical protein
MYKDFIADQHLADANYKGKRVSFWLVSGTVRGTWCETDKAKRQVTLGWFDNGKHAYMVCNFDGTIEWPGAERFFISGICRGLKDGQVVIEKCEIHGYSGWGG